MGHQIISWAGLWFGAGFMAGIAAAFFLMSLRRKDASFMQRHKFTLIAGALLFAVLVFAMNDWHGQPEIATAAADSQGDSDASNPFAAAMNGMPTDNSTVKPGPGSMEQAAIKLATRLHDNGGSDADWDLLKKSYEFLHDDAGAALAAQHRVKNDVRPEVVVTPHE